MNILNRLGRQMRTAVTALNSTRGVVRITGSKTGLVAASIPAHRDIAAMRKRDPKDRLIKGVPYVMRRQGHEALAAHINDPLETGDRFSLPCNTGPAGSGKTVLQRQNMLQAARDFGFLAVEIEFNGIQSIDATVEENANFARLLANRILCYLPKYRELPWNSCLQEIAKDFEGKAAALSKVTEAVQVLKKALNHEGPVLLAVDELVRAPGNGKENLTFLCQMMDDSLRTHDTNGRILLAVSVYDLVDLGTFVTGSKRKLVHQQLPPILPLLLDSEVEECLPPWLQVFFNEEVRKEVKATEAIGSIATLLTESAGHPRRVKALLHEVKAISNGALAKAKHHAERKKRTPSERELQRSQLQAVAQHSNNEKCLVAMNAELDLRDVGSSLSVFVREEADKDASVLKLLKYLFTTVNMQNPDAGLLRSATTCHYQLVPHGSGHVGYLPLPALQQFCAKLKKNHNKEVRSYVIHAKGVATANLSATRNTKQRSTHFEMGMFHTLCGAVLAREGLTKDMFRHPPGNLPETCCTEIEWAKDVELFPHAVEAGPELRVCDDETLRRILSVGAVNTQDGEQEKSFTGLAFVPTDEGNTCCDFVLVLPTADVERAGRVVFAVQCKHWDGELAGGKGLHSLAYFRYGRHCFEADQVYPQKKRREGAAERIENSFLKKFRKHVEQNKDSDTRVVFVLATVNDVMLAGVHPNVFTGVNLPNDAKYKSTALLEDEGLMDLQHMCGWCPTVGYGALLAEKVRAFPFVSDGEQAKAA